MTQDPPPREFFTAGTFKREGRKIRYYRSESDKPPVVLIHGIGVDSSNWGGLPRHLASDYDVTLIDLRGHGHSELGSGSFGRQDLADDLIALIRELGLAQPTLIGH